MQIHNCYRLVCSVVLFDKLDTSDHERPSVLARNTPKHFFQWLLSGLPLYFRKPSNGGRFVNRSGDSLTINDSLRFHTFQIVIE